MKNIILVLGFSFYLLTFKIGYCSSLYSDTLDPSQNPPAGLQPAQVPMFVVMGFDDNGWSGWPGSAGTGGMRWATDLFASRKNPQGNNNSSTFDGKDCRASFYYTTEYINTWSETVVLNKKSWY